MKKQFPEIYLASRSPRRCELLDQIGVCYKVVLPNVPEQRAAAESPADYVCRLASSKAHAGWEMTQGHEKRPVLGADTVVVLGDSVMEKPHDREHGIAMLAALSGRVHHVMTGMALVTEKGCDCVVSVSRVHFRKVARQEQVDYWATGEPEGKAGGYAIQGFAAAFIERIEGSYSGIMGLSLFELTQMLTKKQIK